MGNFRQQIQMLLYQKPRTFQKIFIAFLKSTSNFEYFEKKKKMSLIAEVFPKLLTAKEVAT